MDIREVRRHNLKKLMDSEFGVGARGAQSRLAEKLRKPQNFISRCLFDPEKSGAKTIGEDFAREIESEFGLARYALDTPISDGAAKEGNVVSIDSRRKSQDSRFVTIPHLDVAGSMGSGRTPPDYLEVIRDITVHLDWLKTQGLSYSKQENLAIIDGDGDSMEGTFRNGDALLVDRGISEIRTDAIYVFTLDGDLFIKRLQRLAGGSLRMISDNPVYPAIMIEGDALDRIHIQARVLLVWNARRL